MISARRGLLFGIAGWLIAAAPPVLADTLSQAVMRGIALHPDVRVAQAEVSQATIEVQMARNNAFPALNASSGPGAAGLGYDVTVTQTLYDWGQTGSLMDQRRGLLARQQANLEVVQDDVALQVVEAYLDVVSDRAQLSVLADHLARLEDLSGKTRDRVEARYADLSESGRLNLAIATAHGARATLQGELAEAVGQYELLVEEPANGLRLPVTGPGVLQSVGEDGALDAAIGSSPLYRKAALNIVVADAAVREANAARLPRLNLEGGVQRREIGGQMVSDGFLALRVRFATQQGLSAIQRPRLEAERREAARWAAEAAARDLKRTVSALGRSNTALAAQIDALSDQAAQAEAVRAVYGEQFLVGRRDIQDLVVMATEQYEAERRKTELVIERLRLDYRAAAQLGRLAPFMAGDEMQRPGAIQP